MNDRLDRIDNQIQLPGLDENHHHHLLPLSLIRPKRHSFGNSSLSSRSSRTRSTTSSSRPSLSSNADETADEVPLEQAESTRGVKRPPASSCEPNYSNPYVNSNPIF